MMERRGMEDSLGLGLMAVCAVSGSMVLLVYHVHNHLFSNFMSKFELETGGLLCPHEVHPKLQKKVRFCEVASTKNNKNNDGREKTKNDTMDIRRMVLEREAIQKWKGGPVLEDTMPLNRAILYEGIIKYRSHMGKFGF